MYYHNGEPFSFPFVPTHNREKGRVELMVLGESEGKVLVRIRYNLRTSTLLLKPEKILKDYIPI